MAIFDLFKKDHKHSNPKKRLEAIENTQDPDILLEIILNDNDTSVKNAAVDKVLNSESLLSELRTQLPQDIQDDLTQKEKQQRFHTLFQSQNHSEIDQLFEEFNSPEELQNILKKAQNFHLRKKAYDSITDEAILAKFIAEEKNRELALSLLSRVSDHGLLQKIATITKHKNVKKAIEKSLYCKEEPKANSDEKAKLNQTVYTDDKQEKLAKVISVLKGISTLSNWDSIDEAFEAEKAKWLKLQDAATEKLQAQYDEALAACNASRQAYYDKIAEEERNKKAQEENQIRREQLLEEIANYDLTKISNLADTVQSLSQTWSGIDGTKQDQANDKEFQSAINGLQKKFKNMQREESKLSVVKEKIEDVRAALALLDPESQTYRNDLRNVSKQFKRLHDIPTKLKSDYEALKNQFEKIFAIEKELKINKDKEEEKTIEQYSSILEEAKVLCAKETSKENTQAVKELQSKWKLLPNANGQKAEKLYREFRSLCDEYFDKLSENIEARGWEELNNLAAKEQLIKDVEALKAVEDPRERAKALQKFQADWKKVGPVPVAKSEVIWEQFKTICDDVYEVCRAYYDDNLDKKKLVFSHADALKDSEEWKETAEKLKVLQERWKKIGPAPRKDEQEVWEAFRAACDHFFERRKKHFDELNNDRQRNLEIKQDLVSSILAVYESEDFKPTTSRIIELQKTWKETGPAPREDEQELWTKFREAADSFFGRKKAFFSAKDEEKTKNLEEKEALITELKNDIDSLNEESDWSALARKFKDVQKQWKTIGPVPKSNNNEAFTSFRKVCDEFFNKRNEHFDQLSKEESDLLAQKEELCLKVELLAEATEWKENTEVVKAIQEEWKTIGSINEKYDGIIYKRFRKACDTFFDNKSDAYEVLAEQREENFAKKETLARRMAELAGTPVDYDEPMDSKDLGSVVADLQKTWSEGDLKSDRPANNYREMSQEVREIQATWKSIGPVPQDKSQAQWERFEKYVSSFYKRRQEFRNKKTAKA